MEAAERGLVQVVAVAEAVAMSLIDAGAEVAVGLGSGLGGSDPAAVGEVGMQAAWTACDYPASWPVLCQGAEGAGSGMVANMSLVVADAASAPALQLEGYRKAGSVCRRKLAEAVVLGYVVGGQAEQG